MDTTTALNTLRLAEGAGRSDILAAFTRLARRYPMQQFPERHAALLEAKTFLLSPENFIKELLNADNPDVSWLNRHSKVARAAQCHPAEGGSRAEASCLHTMLRPHLQEGELLFPRNSVPMDVAGMVERMDPKLLQKWLEEFEF